MGYVVIGLIVVCVLAWGQYYRSNIGKLILYVILWIVAGAALSVVATRIGSDYLHSLAVIGPPMVVGYLSSLEDGEEKGRRLRWWRLVLLIGIVTTAFWLLKKYM